MGAVITRDMRLAARHPFARVLGAVFLVAFLTICHFGLDGDRAQLTALLPGLIWAGFIIAALFAVETLFAEDLSDGSLMRLIVARLPLWRYVSAKAVSFSALTLMPMWIVTVVTLAALGASPRVVAAVSLSLLIAAPAIAAFAVLCAALLAGQRGASMLGVLVAIPLLIPVVIFGLSAADGGVYEGLQAVGYRALLGLDLIAVAVGLPASVAALSSNVGSQ